MDWTPIFSGVAVAATPFLFTFLKEALAQRRKKKGQQQTEADRAKQRAAAIEQYAYTLYSHLLRLATKCGEDISTIPPPPAPDNFTTTTDTTGQQAPPE